MGGLKGAKRELNNWYWNLEVLTRGLLAAAGQKKKKLFPTLHYQGFTFSPFRYEIVLRVPARKYTVCGITRVSIRYNFLVIRYRRS